MIRWLPDSLSGRLIGATLLTLALVLGLWLCGYGLMLSRQHTGWWDSSLRAIAHQILLSLPEPIEQMASPERSYRLPVGVDDGDTPHRLKNHKPAFQVWVRGGQAVFRSPGSPSEPLRADFGDGFADTEVAGQGWRVYGVADAERRVQVQVGWSHAQLEAEHARWVRLSLGATAALFVLLAVPLWLVIRWSLRPVNCVEAAIRRREALDLTPLPTPGLPCEVAPMIESFNRLLERLDASLQGERRFIADAAHELRTPMAALLAQTQLALDAGDDASRRAALLRLREGILRSARLAEQLLDLARLDAGRRIESERRLALYELVEVVARDFEQAAQQRGQRIALELQPGEIDGDIDALGILIRNLLDNAVRYAGDGGRIVVGCTVDAVQVRLTVADDGPGVPASEQGRIFDRFYRVPGNGGRGSGVGLSLVARIAQLHGARIEVGAGIGGRGFGIAVVFAPAAPRPPRAAASESADTRSGLLGAAIQR